MSHEYSTRRPHPLPASMAHGRRRLYGLSLDWGDSSQLIKSPRKHRIAEALPTSVGSKKKTSRPRTNFATTSCYRSFSSFPNFLPASIIAAETSLSERSAIAKLLKRLYVDVTRKECYNDRSHVPKLLYLHDLQFHWL